MAYCTVGDITNSIGTISVAQLTDDTGGETINAGIVSDAIVKADRYINTYCRGTHTVPWAVTPEPVREVSIDLSIRYLYERRTNLELTEGLKDRWKRAEQMLKDIASGKILIDDATSWQNTAGIWAAGDGTETEVYDDDYLDNFA